VRETREETRSWRRPRRLVPGRHRPLPAAAASACQRRAGSSWPVSYTPLLSAGRDELPTSFAESTSPPEPDFGFSRFVGMNDRDRVDFHRRSLLCKGRGPARKIEGDPNPSRCSGQAVAVTGKASRRGCRASSAQVACLEVVVAGSRSGVSTRRRRQAGPELCTYHGP
jgi:hypothetical protein